RQAAPLAVCGVARSADVLMARQALAGAIFLGGVHSPRRAAMKPFGVRLEFRLQAVVWSSAFRRLFGVPPSGGCLDFRLQAVVWSSAFRRLFGVPPSGG